MTRWFFVGVERHQSSDRTSLELEWGASRSWTGRRTSTRPARARGARPSGLERCSSWSSAPGLGFSAIVLYSLQFGAHLETLSVFATSLAIASASALSGSMVGFLFGIPRGRPSTDIEHARSPLSAGSGPQAVPGADTVRREVDIRSNTNLEDISDWLTKILVGVGLTQLGAIGHGLSQLATGLAPALGGVASSEAYALALVVTFVVVGFLTGYLWTRLYLPAAFQRAESEVEAELREWLRRMQAEQQQTAQDVLSLADRPEVPRATIQALAERLSVAAPTSEGPTDQVVAKLAEDYARTRNSLPSGDDRTRRMSRVVADVRSLAQREELSSAAIRSLYEKGDGGRVVALAWLSARPDPALTDLVVNSITSSHSAFELYQALRATEALASKLDAKQAEALRLAIEDQMSGADGKFITPDSDRWSLATRVLALLPSETTDAE